MALPNTRVQRTRGLASLGRSPLTRWPLGGRRSARLLAGVMLGSLLLSSRPAMPSEAIGSTTPTTPVADAEPKEEVRAALKHCGSYPNGSRKTVVDTSRTAVCLPSKFYPKAGFKILFHGATVGYVSNYGGLCSADNPDCWGEGYEFDLTDSEPGWVEFYAKSAVRGVPDYRIRFDVVAA